MISLWRPTRQGVETVGLSRVFDGNPEAYGMRIGPGDVQFTVGGVTENGEFIGPAAEDIVTLGPIDDSVIGERYSDYADLRFS